ncbi:putative type I restriction enzymeP M protein [Thermoflexales bacterium]|nr:putative type I restriction enzymeP M protein [Thermoflexales bacterium]
MFLRTEARFANLLKLPEGANIGAAINAAMKAIEEENEDLRGVLPQNYTAFDNSLLVSLLKTLNFDLANVKGDVFGKIYEYFLGKFAMSEGQKGGEFFTPTSLVKLIVEVIEPYQGRILDPFSGSGGMFVQSAAFLERHKRNPSAAIALFGQEKVAETMRLCRMNLAVHGLSGEIKQGNTFYDDAHTSVGRFDFVMANPPFNVDKVDKGTAEERPALSAEPATIDNANYLCIQIFYSALNATGRTGFVMANSASDARLIITATIIN